MDFSKSAETVAPLMLGGLLHRGPVGIRLTEVEAYLGRADPASHAYGGPHGRAAVMYAEPGSIYVYLSYGIHLAGNVVCSPVGEASAVLLRAGEVVTGVELARLRRWGSASDGRLRSDVELARGPGNLGKALGLSLSDNGELLGGGLFDFEPPERPADRVEMSTRVGIAKNPDALLRFWLPGEPSVSAYRRPVAG